MIYELQWRPYESHRLYAVFPYWNCGRKGLFYRLGCVYQSRAFLADKINPSAALRSYIKWPQMHPIDINRYYTPMCRITLQYFAVYSRKKPRLKRLCVVTLVYVRLISRLQGAWYQWHQYSIARVQCVLVGGTSHLGSLCTRGMDGWSTLCILWLYEDIVFVDSEIEILQCWIWPVFCQVFMEPHLRFSWLESRRVNPLSAT